ncbi:MCP methyltransferase, CheR-type with Tpr repeats [Rippkaea orientalis PCC 8801]|uniref:protein-glutamate O-methyltransferase n=1 Tax=Rippkaea orientalis (strain PCC 8801 / RF-1) TaxID=41431 RepID=B7JYH8_RIPO1|nr:protein-glutamate O-methyltransferase CheR [Rippkaea orientalis]ACK64848.1 MCP methyltransferase, CheR-type with Tpr repeats [Rippkaea orientalis PCC 8801]
MAKKLGFTSQLREAFLGLISQKTGLEIRKQNQDVLQENILARTQTLKLHTVEDYYHLLTSETVQSQKEWKQLITLLTNNESYFFRDLGQFKLLRNTILPELIERNQRTKILRICSAGCSTGPEPYSLAILLKELIPNWQQWNLFILGVDLSQDALEIAKTACYSSWSFRKVDYSIQDKYFNKIGEQYYLNDEIKKMLTFKQCNLVQDPFWESSYGLSNMDLIICRNVFIYFSQPTIAKILDKFYYCLQPLGYLMTGHAEITSNNDTIKKFQSKLFPESVIYQKVKNKVGSELSINSSSEVEKITQNKCQVEKLQNQLNNSLLNSANKDSKKIAIYTKQDGEKNKFSYKILTTTKENISQAIEEVNEIDLLEEVKQLIEQKNYSFSIKKLHKILEKYPNSFAANYLMAEIYANLGKYEEAIDYCHQATTIDSLAVTPHHLLVQIAEERGELEEAKRLLRKIIYLEPYSVAAYLNLANIYQQTNHQEKAQKTRKNALKVLQKLSPDTTIPELGNKTVQDCIIEITNLTN